MTLNGIDISAYQSTLDPAAVPADFVIVKATGGDGYVNPACRDQIAKARAAGKLVGIYHFARDGYTNATAATEAAWFIQQAGDLCDGSTLVVLDWEADNATDVAYAKEWLDTVHAQTGVKPVIYMSFKDIQAADWSPVAAADYGLWEAAYVLGYTQVNGYNPPSGLADIPYWSTRCMWQYTSVGRLPGWGDNLDLDVFYGDAATWAAYAAKNGTTTQSGTTTPLQEDDMPYTADEIKQMVTEGALKALEWKVDNTKGGKTSVLDLARVFDQSRDDTIQGAATEVLNRGIDREGPGQSGASNLRALVAWFDAGLADVKACTDAAVKGVTVPAATVTDAQVQDLADRLNAALPAAVVKALAAKLATA